MPTRLFDWEQRLGDLVAQRLSQPFVWGVNDCVLFAADCVHAVTGVDPVPDLRGQWSDPGSAARAIVRAGGLEAAVQSRGFQQVAALFAQRGDVVLHRREGVDALAVCVGASLAAPSEAGLMFFGLEHGVVAWRV
ncbi:DUF6950 family protein [Comamonas kerstersii]|uniref:DUF6950 family protein n=1 Tax=Comamonas kerstersii TaxID=225992 RepID=UPI000984F00B|nr:hypothetical protein [Comamonas kerstersii]OOH86251.1 hypothetical protein BMF38_08945 [Comamonas kerstersii]